ncbi:MAG: glutamate--tRNA ligase family protein, partial [Vicinamibacteria bacterium]
MADENLTAPPASSQDFIREIVAADVAAGSNGGRVVTRFPPEPNGYLHIGHAKAITLDFGIAAEFGGHCNLRFDDTNPVAEDPEYVDAIIDDLRWLGFEPDEVVHASDYFDQLYEWAEELVRKGLAYVDDQDAETISAQRGRFGEPGQDSPFRDRTPEENLDLFRRMRDGEFEDGSRVLRAKIDMAHPVMTMRDPVLYRIRRVPHQRTDDRWIIYPTYDWAHGQSDAIEGVTHPLCTLEFADHRPLYDWCL